MSLDSRVAFQVRVRLYFDTCEALVEERDCLCERRKLRVRKAARTSTTTKHVLFKTPKPALVQLWKIFISSITPRQQPP